MRTQIKISIIMLLIFLLNITGCINSSDNAVEINNRNIELKLVLNKDEMKYNDTDNSVDFYIKNKIDRFVEFDGTDHRGYNVTSIENASLVWNIKTSGGWTGFNIPPNDRIRIESFFLKTINLNNFADYNITIGDYLITGYYRTVEGNVELHSDPVKFSIVE
jgi:hypothetical protein